MCGNLTCGLRLSCEIAEKVLGDGILGRINYSAMLKFQTSDTTRATLTRRACRDRSRDVCRGPPRGHVKSDTMSGRDKRLAWPHGMPTAIKAFCHDISMGPTWLYNFDE